jgi:hypothetical protein
MAVVTIDAAAQVAASNGATGWSARGTFEVPNLDVCQLVHSTSSNVGNSSFQIRIGQSFTTTSAFSLAAVRLNILKVLAPTDNWSVDIYADASNNPTGGTLATSDLIAGAGISTVQHWHEFVFSSPPSLSTTTKYWIVLQRSGAVDASNYVNWRHSAASSYASNGRIVDSSGIWGAESGTIDMTFETVKTTSSLYQVTQDTGGSPEFHMHTSTDNAASWSEVDTGNGPTVFNTAYPWSADWSKAGLNATGEGNAIVLYRFTNTNTTRMTPFFIGSQTWGADLGGADASTDAVNNRNVRAYITPIEQGGFHTALADDADITRTRRTTSTWSPNAWNQSTAADGSTLSDAVKDNSVYGSTTNRFLSGFIYDAAQDDFSVQTLAATLAGTLLDLDTTAAPDNTKHASATYHVYDPGTDTVIAAYIDSDDTLQERTAQLEVTAASITLGTQHQVTATTSYAGRQLSTCKFGSDLYVFASLGTGIDYYKDTGASGTWGSVNNWKSGLTNCFLSQAVPIDGVGILVVYNDNGDVKCDIAEAVAGNVTVNGALATATSAANVGTWNRTLGGSLSTATAEANAGTVFVSYHVDGSLATADGAALAGTLKAAIAGALATGSGAALSGSLKAAIAGAVASATAEALAFSLIAVDLTGSVAAADGQAYSGSLGTGSTADGSLATADASALTGTIVIDIPGALATASGLANLGSIDILIQGGNATATGTANASTVAVDLSGSLATADASAFSGSLAIDIAGLTATADAVANDGVAFSGYTVLGSLATASAQANDGTTGIDDGTSNGDDKYRLFQLRTLPTSAEE